LLKECSEVRRASVVLLADRCGPCSYRAAPQFLDRYEEEHLMNKLTKPERPTLQRSVLASDVVLTTVCGSEPGPTLALLGGVHGDEEEGVLAVRRILLELMDLPLRGTIRAVAPAHPVAWAARSRTSPIDGGNLARCFPGDATGSPTQLLAAEITAEVITGADILLDLHSAGANYFCPLLCGYTSGAAVGEAAARAAHAFGAPLVWAHPDVFVPGRSLSAAQTLGIPGIYAECSGGSGITTQDLEAYIRGSLSVMAELNMLPSSFRVIGDTSLRVVYGSGDLDQGAQSPQDGLFVATTTAGAIVRAGDEVGKLYHYDGRLITSIVSPQVGMVMFLRRKARTQRDEILFALADLEGGE